MKRKITIAPISRNKGTTQILPGKYTNTKLGSIINILTNGKVVMRDCEGSEKTKNIIIHDQNPEFTFTWDDKEDAEKIVEAKAWSKNPMVDCPDNYNLQRAMFKMIDKTEKTSIDVKKLKYKGRIYNIINNMTVEEMRDIAFFMGLNPIHQSPEEIFISLVDFQDGKLMLDPEKIINNITTPDMNYIVIGKKAILYDVIQKKQDQYFVNNELIGSSFNDVLAYLKANKQQFENYITKEVEKLDVLPVDIDYEEPVKEIIGMVKKLKEEPKSLQDGIKEVEEESIKIAEKEEGSSIEELRVIGKELKIKSWQIMGKEKLTEEIEKVKMKKDMPELVEAELA